MPHKLLILHSIEGELVRQNPFQVKLQVKNLGESSFSGKFTLISIESRQADYATSKGISELPSIHDLGPNNSIELGPFIFFLMAEGFAWIKAVIVADDNQPVEHCQNPSFSMGNEWRNGIYVKKREDVEIIGLLRQIVSLLPNKV